MQNPKVAILILHYGSTDLTKKCLQSLQQSLFQDYYILILDNSGCRQLDSSWFCNLKQVQVFYTSSNMGFAAGCNFLAQKAIAQNSDYLLFLNNDTVASPGLIMQLSKVAKNKKKLGAISCIITYQNQPQKIWFGGGYLHPLFYFTRHHFINKPAKSLPKDMINCDWITGCCLFVSTQVWKKVGEFDPAYYSYFEDVAWCYRAKNMGLQNLVVNQILLQHAVSANFGIKGKNTLSTQRAYYYARNSILFIRKNIMGVKKYLALSGQLSFVLAYYVLNMLKTGAYKSIFSYYKGIYDGLIK